MSGNIDTVRWGDSATLIVPPSGGPALITSRMLCYATSPKGGRPIAWAFLMSVIPAVVPAEASDFVFTFNLTVGCGSATIPFPQIFQVIHPNYAPVAQLITIPASNIMANVIMTAAGGAVAGSSFQVACMAAPIFDPTHAATLLEYLRGEQGAQPRQLGDDMPPGFIEEGLARHHNRQ